MKWISYNIFQNFPLFIIHRLERMRVSFALILVRAIKTCGADLIFTFLSTLLKYMVVAALWSVRCVRFVSHQGALTGLRLSRLLCGRAFPWQSYLDDVLTRTTYLPGRRHTYLDDAHTCRRPTRRTVLYEETLADQCADGWAFPWSAHGLRVRWLQAFLITPPSAMRSPGEPTRRNRPPSSPRVPTWPTVGKGRFPGLSASRGAAPPAQYATWPRC